MTEGTTATMDANHVYDAIVVGSGAAGGWAVKELAERGCDTLLLEAGRSIDLKGDFPPPDDGGGSKIQLVSRAKAVLGGQHVQARCMSFSPLTKHLFVSDRENPYTTADGKPFNWYRGRQVGGRMHLWGRNAVRLSDSEFKGADLDGFGENWPISYGDLAPWYERVETFLGVSGTRAGIANLPDGTYFRPHPVTQIEQQILDTLGEKWPDRPATTARIVKHNPERVPTPVLAGLASGNLTLRSDAVVSHLTVDEKTGKADGVAFVDRVTGASHVVRAKTVVLGASTIESLRILLNSKSKQHPNGLGNSSGNLGRYLTDHVMVFQAGPHEPLEGTFSDDPYDFGAQTGIYMPNFRNREGPEDLGFLRGYSLLGSVGRIAPGWFFMAVGEMLPRADNRVQVDPRKTDKWGIPVAKIRCVHSDNEKAMVRDMNATLTKLAQDVGLESDTLGKEGLLSRIAYKFASKLVYTPEGALVPGSAIHEAGGAGMGDDPGTHVLNANAQCYDSPNVFVTDSAAFTTSPFQNPGLTIMALSARAGNFIADGLEADDF